VDLENARIMTESFMQTEGQPYVVRKAKAFKEQCERKTVLIWEDELVVGQAGSKLRLNSIPYPPVPRIPMKSPLKIKRCF
jgi:hypothetical protein